MMQPLTKTDAHYHFPDLSKNGKIFPIWVMKSNVKTTRSTYLYYKRC